MAKLKLTLKEDGILEGLKSNNVRYTVRADRHRYFFPNEWESFYKTFKDDTHRLLFATLLHTGCRIMEALHLKAKSFDFQRGTITFEVIKQRKAKHNYYALGKARTFFVSRTYLNMAEQYLRKYRLEPTKYIFLDNNKLPSDYDSLSNVQRRKFFCTKSIIYSNMLKSHLRKAGIEDWKKFSLHNIRKTYGNWMRIYDIKLEELCYRMGHDMETFLQHYGSAMIFTAKERTDIMRIMGEVR